MKTKNRKDGLIARAPLAAAVVLALVAGSWDTTVSFGMSERTNNPSEDLIGKATLNPLIATQGQAIPGVPSLGTFPGSVVQITAPGRFSSNRDDGNILYGDGDAFSQAFKITSITSNSGTVRAQNADNGGNGVSSPAVYDYSGQARGDQKLAANETSGVRRLRFTNANAEMFQFSAVVSGHLPDSANAGGSAGSDGGTSGGTSGTSSGGTGGTGGTSGGSTLLSGVSLKFVVNPLTKSVSVSLK